MRIWTLLAPLLALVALAQGVTWRTVPVPPQDAPLLLSAARREIVGILVNPPPSIVEAVGRALRGGARAELLCVGRTCSPLAGREGVLALVDGEASPESGAVAGDTAFVLVLDPAGWYRVEGSVVRILEGQLRETVREVKAAYAAYKGQ